MHNIHDDLEDDDFDDFEIEEDAWDLEDIEEDVPLESVQSAAATPPPGSGESRTFLQKYFYVIVFAVLGTIGGLWFLGSSAPEPSVVADQNSDAVTATVPERQATVLPPPGSDFPFPDENGSDFDNLDFDSEPAEVQETVEAAPGLDLPGEENVLTPLPGTSASTQESLESFDDLDFLSEDIQEAEAVPPPPPSPAMQEPVPDDNGFFDAMPPDDNDLKLENMALSEKNDKLETLVRESEEKVASLTQKVKTLENQLSKLKEEQKKALSQPPKKTSSKTAQTASKTTSKPKLVASTKLKPTVPEWQLRSARPGQAVLAKPGSNEFVTIGVGDTLSGIGRVQSIGLDSGKWRVQGTLGSVFQ